MTGRACTLSSALHTPLSPSQKVSSYVPSVSGPIRSSRASTWQAEFIALIAATAVSDLALVTSHGRKRNWRLRFDFSIVSGSVTRTCGFAEMLAEMIAEICD